jgi:single-stranded DNA-binding protein
MSEAAKKVNEVAYQGKVYKIRNLAFTPNGTPVCNARMSVSKKFGEEWQSFWFNLTAWGDAADILAECQDKDEVVVRGRLEATQSFKTRAGEEVPTGFGIAANEVERLGTSAPPAAAKPAEDLADLPF